MSQIWKEQKNSNIFWAVGTWDVSDMPCQNAKLTLYSYRGRCVYSILLLTIVVCYVTSGNPGVVVINGAMDVYTYRRTDVSYFWRPCVYGREKKQLPYKRVVCIGLSSVSQNEGSKMAFFLEGRSPHPSLPPVPPAGSRDGTLVGNLDVGKIVDEYSI